MIIVRKVIVECRKYYVIKWGGGNVCGDFVFYNFFKGD